MIKTVWFVTYRWDDCASGYLREWFSTRREARERAKELNRFGRENDDIEPPRPAIENAAVDISLAGVLRALNRYADNG